MSEKEAPREKTREQTTDHRDGVFVDGAQVLPPAPVPVAHDVNEAVENGEES